MNTGMIHTYCVIPSKTTYIRTYGTFNSIISSTFLGQRKLGGRVGYKVPKLYLYVLKKGSDFEYDLYTFIS